MALFTQTIECGTVPREWRDAIISPIFTKGDIQNPANYRPVSLSSIVSKVMEHMLCKHILNHLERHGALTSFQHGFRCSRLCETKLLLTMDDLMRFYDRKRQVDIGILDFSHAFNTVPHERLLGKLVHYAVQGPVINWVHSFLQDRKMKVAVDGVCSPGAGITSGVPQGTVLGPLLFLFISTTSRTVSRRALLFVSSQTTALFTSKYTHTMTRLYLTGTWLLYRVGQNDGGWLLTLARVIYFRSALAVPHPIFISCVTRFFRKCPRTNILACWSVMTCPGTNIFRT